MSDMEAMKVVLTPLSLAHQRQHLEALESLDDEDEYEYCQGNKIMLLDGGVYSVEEKELDPYGFADASWHDGVITVVGLWYNGGASLQEIVEEAVRNLE